MIRTFFNFKYVTDLQYKIKALTAKIQAYEFGETCLRLKEQIEKMRREKDRITASLKKELEKAHRETKRMQVLEDMEKEHKKALAAECTKTARMEQRALSAESERDEWKDKWKGQQVTLYAVQTELEREKERNRKLTAQMNRDFENSSLPFRKAA